MGCIGIGLVVLADGDLYGVDAYYHIRLSALMREHGIIRDFPWAQASIFAKHFSDKEFLYHALLIPFTFGDLLNGARLASCLAAGALFAVYYAVIRRLRLRFPLLWTLVLLCSGPAFISRVAMTRPHVLSLLLLLVAIALLSERRYFLLGVLGFVYALSYSVAHLVVALALLFNVGLLLGRERVDLRTVLFPGVGLVLGFLAHPNFPENVRLWCVQTFLAPLYAWGFTGAELNQGIELAPPTGRNFLFDMTPVTVALAASILGYLWRGQRPSARSWTLICITGFFLSLTLLSMRFVEYFVPFALLFSACAFTDIVEDLDLDEWLEQRKFARNALPVALLLFLMLTGMSGVLKAQAYAAKDSDASTADAVLWLKEKVPAGETVFHTEWGDFTELFCYAPELRYLVALDPVFMYVHSPSHWREWRDICEGRRPDAASLVRSEFNSRYVFLRSSRRRRLDRLLRGSQGAREVYRNSEIAIYELQETEQ